MTTKVIPVPPVYRIEVLGAVAVDSGQVMVVDPCYVLNDDNVTTDGLQFWGAGAEALKAFLEQQPLMKDFTIHKKPDHGYRIFVGSPDLRESIRSLIHCWQQQPTSETIVLHDYKSSLYSTISDITLGPDSGGEFIAAGIGGSAVACSSGVGDGCYETKAYFATLDLWGERVTKIETVFISDAEVFADHYGLEEIHLSLGFCKGRRDLIMELFQKTLPLLLPIFLHDITAEVVMKFGQNDYLIKWLATEQCFFAAHLGRTVSETMEAEDEGMRNAISIIEKMRERYENVDSIGSQLLLEAANRLREEVGDPIEEMTYEDQRAALSD